MIMDVKLEMYVSLDRDDPPPPPPPIDPVCGDGILSPPEECDDRNLRSGDGCSRRCKVSCGWKCPVVGKKCVRDTCGDGIVDAGEACDDGNNDDGDDCSKDCSMITG